jgi:hypothetical protein
MIKHYLEEVLDGILEDDLSLRYTIECEDIVLTDPTRDTSLCHGSVPIECSDGVKYEYFGVNQTDESHIYILRGNDRIGWLHWIAFNDGVERLSDWNFALEKLFNINSHADDWQDRYEQL